MKLFFGIFFTIVGFFSSSSAQSVKLLPENVHFVAEKGEDVIDYFLKGDWMHAQQIVNSMSMKEKSVVSFMQDNQMPASSVDDFYYFMFRLNALIQQKGNRIQPALVANQITNLLIDIQGHYVHNVPLQVAQMDYLGREIMLLTQVKDDYGLLNRRIAELDKVWKSLQQVVLDKGGNKVAKQVNQVINELQKNVSRQRMIKKDNNILDLVDELENTLRRK